MGCKKRIAEPEQDARPHRFLQHCPRQLNEIQSSIRKDIGREITVAAVADDHDNGRVFQPLGQAQRS